MAIFLAISLPSQRSHPSLDDNTMSCIGQFICLHIREDSNSSKSATLATTVAAAAATASAQTATATTVVVANKSHGFQDLLRSPSPTKLPINKSTVFL